MHRTKLSARTAALRGVGLIPYLTRDAGVLDLELDLAQATGAQLSEQRSAILARMDRPEASDDLAALSSRAVAIAEAIERHTNTSNAAVAARARLAGLSVATVAPGGAPANADEQRDADEGDRREERISTGEEFTRSSEFAAYRAAGATGRSTAVEVRAAFNTTNFPSTPTRVPGIQAAPDAPLTLLDLVDRQSMSTNYIEWIQEIAAPSGATEVAEGSAKPESTWSVEVKKQGASTVAHWVQFTRQALEDEAQIQGYINGRLAFGLEKRINAQVLNGNGTGANLRGILQTTGIGAYVSPAGEDPLISIRKAKTVAQLSEYAPDAVVVSPTDWEAVELSVNDNGTFRASVVTVGAEQRLWGLRVVVSTNIAAGTALVGGFREGATLWERTGTSIYITDSHLGTFTENILTILAEKRVALSVWRPKAFVKVTFTPSA